MPLRKGKSRKVQRANFHELRHGEQFKKTSRKFGKKKAVKQMVAIVLHQAGVGRKRKARRKGGGGKI